MALRKTVNPYAEPLSTEEVKLHLRVDTPDDDAHIANCIAAARDYVEAILRRQLVTATWKLSLDAISGCILLARPPVQSVSSITYVDNDGDTQTWSSSDYTVDTESEPARVEPAYLESYPEYRQQFNAIAVTFKAGYVTPFTVDATTNILTVKGRTFADGDTLRLSNSGGALPGGLATFTDYFVRDASGSTLKLALTAGGTAIDITSTGTGANFIGELPGHIRQAMLLLCGHWNEHRESVLTGTISKEIENGVKALLSSAKWGGYS